MPEIRSRHSATLLPNGNVLVAGGNNPNYLSSAVIYDPPSETWSATGSMPIERKGQPAVLLLNGKVLIAGGYRLGYGIVNADLYDVGLGYQEDWRPVLETVTSPLALRQELVASGSGFRGYRWAEGTGGGTNQSAGNYPLVQLRSLVNGRTTWLPLTAFMESSLAAQGVRGWDAGFVQVTLFVNGIPSHSRVIMLEQPAAWIFMPTVIANR